MSRKAPSPLDNILERLAALGGCPFVEGVGNLAVLDPKSFLVHAPNDQVGTTELRLQFLEWLFLR